MVHSHSICSARQVLRLAAFGLCVGFAREACARPGTCEPPFWAPIVPFLGHQPHVRLRRACVRSKKWMRRIWRAPNLPRTRWLQKMDVMVVWVAVA